MKLASIEEGIEAFRDGEFLLVVDAADRENEADLIMAAEKVTPESVAFMVRYTSGLICQPMLGEQLDVLQLPLMVPTAGDVHHTQFTVSVDYVPGVTTGISAEDRANTILSLIDSETNPPTWPGQDTCSRCATPRAVYCGVQVTPKLVSTWPVWPASIHLRFFVSW